MGGSVKYKNRVLKNLLKVIGTGGSRYQVKDGVPYGVIQEFTDKGHPSLRPAWERVTRELPQLVGQAIEDIENPDDVFKIAAYRLRDLWAADVTVDTSAYRDSIHVEEG